MPSLSVPERNISLVVPPGTYNATWVFRVNYLSGTGLQTRGYLGSLRFAGVPDGGAYRCESCLAGTGSPLSGQLSCPVCQPGTYNTAPGVRAQCFLFGGGRADVGGSGWVRQLTARTPAVRWGASHGRLHRATARPRQMATTSTSPARRLRQSAATLRGPTRPRQTALRTANTTSRSLVMPAPRPWPPPRTRSPSHAFERTLLTSVGTDAWRAAHRPGRW